LTNYRDVNRADVKLGFIGVAAAKAGTSWLAACWAEHPGICMAEPKELNYFCTKAIWPGFRVNRALGSDWLAERFAHRQSGQILGEFSPNYFCDPQSPGLIFDHNPQCRLIFSLRHPVDAVVSYYHQVRKEVPVADTLEGFLDDNPEVCEMGKYHRHARAFLAVFPRGQCQFLFFEDIQRKAAAVLKKSYSFIGVAEDFFPRNVDQRVNELKEPRSKRLLVAVDSIRRLVQSGSSGARAQRWLWKLQVYRLHEWIMQRNLRSFSPPPISQSTRRQLLDLYRDDTRALAGLLERDLSHWEH
jgi:hypothetical protein